MINTKIKYSLDRFSLPKTIHITPSKGEDIDYLHALSMRMQIENPSIEFASSAKLGLFNQYSDEEYEKMLAVAKKLNLLFYSDKDRRPLPEINLFDLTVRLLYEYMLNNHTSESRIL